MAAAGGAVGLGNLCGMRLTLYLFTIRWIVPISILLIFLYNLGLI